jgi:hypothetical protein
MARVFIYLVVTVTLYFGAPYAAAIIFRVMGPWSADAIEADGSVTHMEFGTHLARPDWVPVPSDATIVQASRLTSAAEPTGFSGLELATRMPLDDVKRFYTTELQSAGFTVTDHGLGTLDPATARFLGIDGTLVATRAATADMITVQIRSPEGLVVPSRLLQINWRKAAGVAGPAASAR